MADQKVTIMVLKVDLQCPSCFKKIKKILAKFPRETPHLIYIRTISVGKMISALLFLSSGIHFLVFIHVVLIELHFIYDEK